MISKASAYTHIELLTSMLEALSTRCMSCCGIKLFNFILHTVSNRSTSKYQESKVTCSGFKISKTAQSLMPNFVKSSFLGFTNILRLSFSVDWIYNCKKLRKVIKSWCIAAAKAINFTEFCLTVVLLCTIDSFQQHWNLEPQNWPLQFFRSFRVF